MRGGAPSSHVFVLNIHCPPCHVHGHIAHGLVATRGLDRLEPILLRRDGGGEHILEHDAAGVAAATDAAIQRLGRGQQCGQWRRGDRVDSCDMLVHDGQAAEESHPGRDNAAATALCKVRRRLTRPRRNIPENLDEAATLCYRRLDPRGRLGAPLAPR